MCNAYGCELPGSTCSSEWDCPSNMFCDLSDGTCKTDRVCRVLADCSDGDVCINGQCTKQWGPWQWGSCQDHGSCFDGWYCSNGTCKDSVLCTEKEDCVALGPDMVCDARGTCVPGEAPLQTCETGSTCSDGLCVKGTCALCSGDCGGSTTCQYNKHCADGQACLDGKCTATCTVKEDCGKGQTCQGSVCVADPAASCGNNKACASG